MSQKWYYLVNKSRVTIEVDEEMYRRLAADGNFREATADEIEAYLFSHRPKPKNEMLDIYYETAALAGQRTDGYSQSTGWIEREMTKHKILLNPEYNGQKVGLAYGYPYHLARMKTPIRILYTMFESNVIPEEWVEQLKLADLILVPSKFCQEAFKVRGIETTVVPLGYDQSVFKPFDRPAAKKGPFTFLMYDAFNERKGWRDVFHSFVEAFGQDNSVRLILKTVRQPGIPILKTEYPNIDVVNKHMDPQELAKLLGEADCFVYPSHGEGFGLPPLEAAATGLPAIIPFGSGMSEYANDDCFIPVKFTSDFPPVFDQWKAGVGQMIKVDRKDLAEQMKKVAKMPFPELRNIGEQAAQYARNNFAIERTANRLAAILKDQTGKRVTIKSPSKKRPGAISVAVLMDQINFYSGGRYLNWEQAMMLVEAGYETTVYTTTNPPFSRDFEMYRQPNIEIVANLDEVDIEADIYFGSPEPGTLAAARLGKKYKKPVIVQMFDPPQLLEKNDRAISSETNRDHVFRQWLEENELEHLNMLTLTEGARQLFADWYSIPLAQTACLYPAVNSKILDSFNPQAPRENWIIAVNRNHPRKAWDELFAAFAPYAKTYHLHIVTQSDAHMDRMMKDAGVPTNKVTIHKQISDLEKFHLIARSKAMLSASHFEGFGMWAIEAAALGTPCVAYDLPSMVEIKPKLPLLHLAKYGNVADLSTKLGMALGDTNHHQTTPDFAFAKIRDQFDSFIRAVVSGKPVGYANVPLAPKSPKLPPKNDKLPYPVTTVPPAALDNEGKIADPQLGRLKINVVTMVLNEEKFIRPYLEALIKRPEINAIILVEGADRRWQDCSRNGLSNDKTSQRIRYMVQKYPNRIHWERVGWVGDKSELKNIGLQISKEHYPGNSWVLMTDVDEIFDDQNWGLLVEGIENHKHRGALYFNHLHFWKNPKTLAVGDQWDSQLFRLFRYIPDEDWRIDFHASEPKNQNNKAIGDVYGRFYMPNIYVHHYGGLKDEKDVKAKLDFYSRRDSNLPVIDTWSNWQPGKPTQWTHGGGTHRAYNGTHPKEVKDIIYGKK